MGNERRRAKVAALFTQDPIPKAAPKAPARTYRVGIYVRLSVEDGGLGKDSESLLHQEQLLLDFIADKPDLLLVNVYRDNGETGTDFDRPGFEALIKDLRRGHIDCIVVKDLSRFGRNYIETGEYIDKIFPFMGTRFISMLEGYDNTDPNASNKDLLVNLKNLMNEAYAKDKSMRICSSFDTKKEAGEFNVKKAPFGYKLSGDKKHPYIIDEPAAEIVREIFALRLAGNSIHAIMRLVEDKGYLPPHQYMYEHGWAKTARENPHWDMTAVSRILTNPAYLGHMVRGKTVARLYQGVKKQYVPKDEWEIVENVNEPIIDQETFDAVQKLIREEAEKSWAYRGERKYPKVENVFRGLLFCAECGRALYRAKTAVTPSNVIYYFGCPRYRDHKEKGCTHKPTLRDEILRKTVLEFIKAQVKLADSMIAEMTRFEKLNNTQSLEQQREEQIGQLKERVEKLNLQLRKAFEDYLNEEMGEDDYLFARKKYEAEIESCKAQILRLSEVTQTLTAKDIKKSPYVTSMKKFSRARAVTREMCVALFEHIEIDKDNNIRIVPRYRDEFYRLYGAVGEQESEMITDE